MTKPQPSSKAVVRGYRNGKARMLHLLVPHRTFLKKYQLKSNWSLRCSAQALCLQQHKIGSIAGPFSAQISTAGSKRGQTPVKDALPMLPNSVGPQVPRNIFLCMYVHISLCVQKCLQKFF